MVLLCCYAAGLRIVTGSGFAPISTSLGSNPLRSWKSAGDMRPSESARISGWLRMASGLVRCSFELFVLAVSQRPLSCRDVASAPTLLLDGEVCACW